MILVENTFNIARNLLLDKLGCGMHVQLVGTSSSMENSKLIMYPSITICAFRDSTSKYFANKPYPWFYHQGTSGPTPDPNKILDSLSYHSHINNSRSDVCSITRYHRKCLHQYFSGFLRTCVHRHQSSK